jgi:hypothetical protein
MDADADADAAMGRRISSRIRSAYQCYNQRVPIRIVDIGAYSVILEDTAGNECGLPYDV